MALVSTSQEDFGGGIYRGRKAPPNSFYDLVNGLINDEGLPYRRGGSAYKSDTNAGDVLDMLADSYTAAGRRTVFGSEADGHVWVLDPTDDESPVQLEGTAVRAFSRPAASSGAVFFPSGPTANYPIRAYAGSLLATGTADSVSVTAGSPTVTASGTSWLTTVDPGTIFIIDGSVHTVVREVVSNTEVTLFNPWPGVTDSSILMISTSFQNVDNDAFGDYGVNSNEGVYVTSVGTGQRLVVAVRQRAFISNRNDPFTFEASSYLEIPSDSEITGANSMRDSAVLWTTGGVWLLSLLDLDPVDAFGNVQWQQQQISKDVILWGDPGVSAWGGAFVVPALDDIYIFGLDGTAQAISRSIRPLYRGHVQAGRTPGTAAVFRGHYMLPILEDGEVVDTLVCRLDRDASWTRWAGHAAGAAYALRATPTGEPSLLGLAGQRVTDLTDTFNPSASNATDADGTTSNFELVTRDLPTGANQPGFAQRLRARYELAASGSPTVSVAFSSDQDAGTFTTLTEKGEQGGGTGGGTSDGSKYQWWIVGKRRERIRFRLRITGACSSFVLRSLELLTRPSGKQ